MTNQILLALIVLSLIITGNLLLMDWRVSVLEHRTTVTERFLQQHTNTTINYGTVRK